VEIHDRRELLELLKAELEFIEQGGCRKPGTAWRPPSIFRDSPICGDRNYAGPIRNCGVCALVQFVPSEYKDASAPCHHIPLTQAHEGLEMIERWASPEELEILVKNWLRKAIAEIEAGKPSSGAPVQIKPK
jgi:hypothetical protein